jgi:hypothetical protein
MVQVPDAALRALFDIAVSSMDFGSGFLDDEDVAVLRQTAVILGVDPMTATPQKFRCKYRGHHEAQALLDTSFFTAWPDGLKRNAYLRRDDYPEQVRRHLKPTPRGELGMLRSPRIVMGCPDCGRRWEAFEDTSLRV